MPQSVAAHHIPDAQYRLFAAADQPMRRGLGIEEIEADGQRTRILTRDVLKNPFLGLVEFTHEATQDLDSVLVVPPLSGHFSILLRDLLIGLLPRFRVLVVDWCNIRHVARRRGAFGLTENIIAVRDAIRQVGPYTSVLGVCQGGISALAATALMSATGDPCTAARLILMATPVDALASPTAVVNLLRSKAVSWFETNMLGTVPEGFKGHGRRVYPAEKQVAALFAYLLRHVDDSDVLGRCWLDDGCDPSRFPFADLYSSIMDLDAKYFLENIRHVYQDRALVTGSLRVDEVPIDLVSMHTTRLMTIEGEWDNIAAPGQTAAAHALCASIPTDQHHKLLVPRCGHFSLFYGNTWRRHVLPEVERFLAT